MGPPTRTLFLIDLITTVVREMSSGEDCALGMMTDMRYIDLVEQRI